MEDLETERKSLAKRLTAHPSLVARPGSSSVRPKRLPVVSLHRRFAQIPFPVTAERLQTTMAGIEEFAGEHGLLGLGHYVEFEHVPRLTEEQWRTWVEFPLRSQDPKLRMRLVHGEPLALWLWALRSVKTLIAIWDYSTAIRDAPPESSKTAGNVRRLRKSLYLLARASQLYDEPVPDRQSYRTMAYQPAGDALLITAQNAVINKVNEALHEHCSPQIIAKSGIKPSPRVQAKNLMGAIFAAFAVEIMGLEQSPKRCPGCGRLFLPDRPNQVYHDPACGNRFRSRKYDRGKAGS